MNQIQTTITSFGLLYEKTNTIKCIKFKSNIYSAILQKRHPQTKSQFMHLIRLYIWAGCVLSHTHVALSLFYQSDNAWAPTTTNWLPTFTTPSHIDSFTHSPNHTHAIAKFIHITLAGTRSAKIIPPPNYINKPSHTHFIDEPKQRIQFHANLCIFRVGLLAYQEKP